GSGAGRPHAGARHRRQELGAGPWRHSCARQCVRHQGRPDQPHRALDHHSPPRRSRQRGCAPGHRRIPVAHQIGDAAQPDGTVEDRPRSEPRRALTQRAEGSRRGRCTRLPRAVTRTDGGFVLVSVLWLLALLTLVMLVLLTAVRLDVRATGQLIGHAEAEALADGLMRLVALRLGDRERRPLTDAGLARNGTPIRCEHRHGTRAVAVPDFGGLVDLNAASARLLEWLLRGLDVAPEKATALAAAIVDFRDADDVPSINGAESAAYRTAGLGHGPKNALFETVT